MSVACERTHTHSFAFNTFFQISFDSSPLDYVNLYLTVVPFSKTVHNIINFPSANVSVFTVRGFVSQQG